MTNKSCCCVINPQRNKKEPKIPPVGIVAVNPSDSHCVAELAQRYELQRHYLFNSHLYSNAAMFLAGPAVGAPMAVMCMEKLIALGANKIIFYGWCGSIHPCLHAGELFAPTDCFSEEGTSVHYQPAAMPFDNSLHASMIEAMAARGYLVKQGKIWTTDAVYRETRDKVERYSAQGVLAVDMEYAALRAVAMFRQVAIAALMLASDELFHPKWEPQYCHRNFRNASRSLLENLCELIPSYLS